MTKAARERYHARMQRVLNYIDQHIDEDLGLEILSGVAAFSKHHFHRQFMAFIGIPKRQKGVTCQATSQSYRLAFRDGDA